MDAPGSVLLDLALAGVLVFAASRALHSRTLFTGVVFYIAFGLLLALIWVRLEAPDLALAEAAIGAGVIGAMLLDAARQMAGDDADEGEPAWPAAGRAAALVGAAGFTALLAAIFLGLPRGPVSELPAAVAANLPETGATHPVTAVLLDYRAYDTWLEVAVLLAAATGVLVLVREPGRSAVPDTPVSVIARGTAAMSAPFGLLVAGYLLWRGTSAPGGAFQAGAILGALAILLTLIGRDPVARARTGALYLTLTAGVAVFLAVGLVGYARSGSFLDHPDAVARPVILLVETGVTLGVGATVALLFSGGRTAGIES